MNDLITYTGNDGKQYERINVIDEESGAQGLEFIRQVLTNGIRRSNQLGHNIPLSEMKAMTEAWIEIIEESVHVVSEVAPYLRQEVAPAQIFFEHLHAQFHDHVDSDHWTETIVYPVVAQDGSGFYFMFAGEGIPIKVLNLINTDELKAIEVVTEDSALEAQTIEPAEMESLTSLCRYIRGAEMDAMMNDPILALLTMLLSN